MGVVAVPEGDLYGGIVLGSERSGNHKKHVVAVVHRLSHDAVDLGVVVVGHGEVALVAVGVGPAVADGVDAVLIDVVELYLLYVALCGELATNVEAHAGELVLEGQRHAGCSLRQEVVGLSGAGSHEVHLVLGIGGHGEVDGLRAGEGGSGEVYVQVVTVLYAVAAVVGIVGIEPQALVVRGPVVVLADGIVR